MESPEKEQVHFHTQVDVFIENEPRNIEEWLLDIEKEMFSTMRHLLRKSV